MARRNRTPVTQAPKVGLQAEFEKHTETVYEFMRYRLREKKNSAGVVIAPARPLPFTLREFRRWLLAGAFRGCWDNAVQCAYCTAWLNCSNFVTDHRDPLEHGGGIDLDNLCLSCESCNSLKSAMSERGFRKMLEWVTVNLDARDANDMFGRMKGKLHMQIMAIQRRKAAGRPTTSRRFIMPPMLGGR